MEPRVHIFEILTHIMKLKATLTAEAPCTSKIQSVRLVSSL